MLPMDSGTYENGCLEEHRVDTESDLFLCFIFNHILMFPSPRGILYGAESCLRITSCQNWPFAWFPGLGGNFHLYSLRLHSNSLRHHYSTLPTY
jgi:hypothetical protein